MVAALGDFDVGGGFGRGEEARGGFVVEIGGQQVGCALPVVAAEAALALAVVAFGGSRCVSRACAWRPGILCRGGPRRAAPVRMVKGEPVAQCRAGADGSEAGGFEDGFEFAGADYGVDFGDALAGFRRGSARRGSRRR